MQYIGNRILAIGLSVLLLGTLGAGAVYYASQANAEQTPPEMTMAVQVAAQTVQEENVRVWTNFPGRLQAVDYAEIRPEVGGRITEVRFQDGQYVKQGDVLFVIDPRPYEAAVAKANANLALARTNAEFAQAEARRAEGLIGTQTIPKRVYEERVNANRVAQATVSASEAELNSVRLQRDYAYIKAPISGQASRAELTVGNLVQPGANAPVLTSIVSRDGIYADFEVDEQTYVESILKARQANGDVELPVEMTLQGNNGRVYHGIIDSFDNRIDTASGTIRARAQFANDDGSLIPGMFVSVKLASSGNDKLILVPDRAVSSDQNKRFVYLVGDGNKVVYREVHLGKNVADRRIVTSGLQPGDRVITDGIQHVFPDAVVEIKDSAALVAGSRPASEPASE